MKASASSLLAKQASISLPSGPRTTTDWLAISSVARMPVAPLLCSFICGESATARSATRALAAGSCACSAACSSAVAGRSLPVSASRTTTRDSCAMTGAAEGADGAAGAAVAGAAAS